MSAAPETTYTSPLALADSDVECHSLCGSELELEMAWGEGPIAPLRTEPQKAEENKADGDAPVRPTSNGRGSSRAKTPQKRANASPLARSQRLINIHPIRSMPYLPKPNELPVGVRKQQRWFNDHHFGNRAVTASLEDLMEHMTLNVEWKSNFQKLGQPENKELLEAFRKARVRASPPSNQPKCRRSDDWKDAEEMFSRIDRRARTLLIRSFKNFSPFLEAVEYVVLHFVQWRELPSEIELSANLTRVLTHPLEIMHVNENDIRMCIPLVDSAFHRLMIHSVCQFYGVRSRTEANRKFNTKIMILRCPKKALPVEKLAKLSLCDFIRETRSAKQPVDVEAPTEDELEGQTKSSECSDGFCMMEFPDA